jgi:hypothetical protein
VLLCIGLPGCTGFGPNRLESDQLQYARAISDSQKRQILLNIVRLRYADTPTFFSANQVISSYTLEQRAELGLNLYPNARGGNYATGLGGVTFSDHPTVTFAPLSGEQVARTAIRPLSPTDLLQFAQGALPIEVVFRLGVQSIGPLRNTLVLGGEQGAGLPQRQFFELLIGMRRLQVAGLLTVRFVRRKDGNHVFLGIANGSDQELRAVVVQVRRLLGMTPGQTEAGSYMDVCRAVRTTHSCKFGGRGSASGCGGRPDHLFDQFISVWVEADHHRAQRERSAVGRGDGGEISRVVVLD